MIHLPRKRCNLVPPCAVKIQRKSDVCVTCHETLHLIKIEILSVRKKSSLCTANIARPHLRVTDLVPHMTSGDVVFRRFTGESCFLSLRISDTVIITVLQVTSN